MPPAVAAVPAIPAPPPAIPAHPVSIPAPTALTTGLAPADAVRDAEYWLDDYGIRDAWATTRGEGVVIAIIDTGIDSGVRDLAGAVIGGADFSGLGYANGQKPVGRQSSEHATMVAALAAGRGTGAGSGILGAAPEASLLSLSIGFGEGDDDSDTQIAEAVRWAVDNGADVINMSLTRNTLDWPESWDDAFLYAMEHDVVVVAAAGNRASGTTEVGAPATMPGVLTVSGVDRSGAASFDASSQGITIGVAAPSEQLVGVIPGGQYVTWSGTSGATPIVAGIVALVRAAHPDLDAANVINRIIRTAHDRGPSGADFTYGYGLVDAAAAVTADVALVDANPVGDLAEWIRLNRRAEATPSPTTVALPEPVPDAEPGFPDPTGTLLPSITTLQLVGLPALVVGMLAFVAGGMVTGAVRAYGSRRRAR
ncbi:MAG: S8 family serine peptidase [Microbacteriaceae bacterium]|nr:S8 family serine peptidase [Microbacteriaceae bacterium]